MKSYWPKKEEDEALNDHILDHDKPYTIYQWSKKVQEHSTNIATQNFLKFFLFPA